MSSSKQSSENEDLKKRKSVGNYWLVSWAKHFPGEKELLGIKERSNIKYLVDIYGEEKVLNLIDFYFARRDSLSYLKGRPSIGALTGFRKRLVEDMEKLGSNPAALDPHYDSGLM
jgi:hypothetical protein